MPLVAEVIAIDPDQEHSIKHKPSVFEQTLVQRVCPNCHIFCTGAAVFPLDKEQQRIIEYKTEQ